MISDVTHMTAPFLNRTSLDLKNATTQFESVFAQRYLNEMMQPSSEEDSLFGSGPGSQLVKSMFEQTLADQIAASGGLGIGKALERSLQSSHGPQVEKNS